jgi:hypothetical protein
MLGAVAEIISLLNEQQGLSMSVETVSTRKENFYRELLPQLQAIPEVLEQIDAQHGRIPFAVVSGSTRESVIASLVSLKLLDRFDTMVCAGDYRKSKPDPECFPSQPPNSESPPKPVGYRHGRSGSSSRRNGFRKDSFAVGNGCRLKCLSRLTGLLVGLISHQESTRSFLCLFLRVTHNFSQN